MSVSVINTPTVLAPRPWPKPLLVILGAGAVVRVLLWLWFAPLEPRIWDENDYVQLARNIATHGEFAFSPGDPTSLRPPLYPAFVAAIYRVAGIDNYQAVRLAQLFVSLATVVLVYRLGRVVFSERTGLWAAGLLCFSPSYLGSGNLILTEALFTFWLTAGTLALVTGLNRGQLTYLAGAGVLLGLGALTRSILWLCPPLVGLFLLGAWPGSLGRRFLAAVVFAVPFALVLAPWAVRNTELQKTLVVVDCMGGRNFMMGNYEYTPLYRSWDAIAIEGDHSWHTVLCAETDPALRDTQGKLDKLALARGLKFVKENPGLSLQRGVIKFFDFWGLDRELVAGADRGFFGPISRAGVIVLGLLVCGFFAVVLSASVFGAVLQPPRDIRVHLLLLAIVAFVCGIHSVVFAHSRYRLPVMPVVMLYAAAAITSQGIWSRRHRPGFWIAVGVCLLFVGGWVWNAVAGDFARVLQAVGLGS